MHVCYRDAGNWKADDSFELSGPWSDTTADRLRGALIDGLWFDPGTVSARLGVTVPNPRDRLVADFGADPDADHDWLEVAAIEPVDEPSAPLATVEEFIAALRH